MNTVYCHVHVEAKKLTSLEQRVEEGVPAPRKVWEQGYAQRVVHEGQGAVA